MQLENVLNHSEEEKTIFDMHMQDMHIPTTNSPTDMSLQTCCHWWCPMVFGKTFYGETHFIKNKPGTLVQLIVGKI